MDESNLTKNERIYIPCNVIGGEMVCGHKLLIQDEAKHYINQVVIILLYQCTYNIYVG